MNATLEVSAPATQGVPRRWLSPSPVFERPVSLGMALLDQLDCGIVVCDEQGAVHHANRSARDEIIHGGLLADEPRRLDLAPGTRGELAIALLQAARRGRRSLVTLARDIDHLTLTVQPLAMPDLPGLVLVMLGRRHLCSDLGIEMLAVHHRLTLAERRVLRALTRCRSPKEIAIDHGVTLSTVRSQIAAIHDKLGARTVEAVLLRAAQVPPVTCAVQGAAVGRPMPLAA